MKVLETLIMRQKLIFCHHYRSTKLEYIYIYTQNKLINYIPGWLIEKIILSLNQL